MVKPIGKLVRLRASRLDKEGCDIFCLPLGFRDALLDLAERMEWGATWLDADGGRAELTEQQKETIESGMEALSMACEIVINNNVTVEPSQLDVNVNNSGGNGTDCRIIPLPDPLRPDGTVINTVCLPVDPENPSGEYPVEEVDEENLVPPAGWPDWNSFIDEKCRAANYMVDALIGVAESIDDAENRVSIFMHIVETIIEFMPIPAQKSVSWQKVLKWVEALGDFVDDVEGVWDWIQTMTDIVEDKRNEIVCLIYTSPDVLVAAAAVASTTIDELLLVAAFDQLTDQTKNAFIAFWTTLINDIIPRAYDYQWVLSIPEGYQASYNCAACGGGDLGGGWRIVPIQFDSLLSVGGSGGSAGHSITNLGSYIRATAQVDSPNDVAHFTVGFKGEEAAGLWFYGFHLDTQNLVNASGSGFVASPSNPPHLHLNQCNRMDSPPVPLWGITENNQAAQFELDTGISVNVGAACVSPQAQLLDGSELYDYTFSIESVLSGTISADYKLFLIVRDTELQI